ncbi:MAG TPA: hypothetical protein VFV87_16810 [Pirellulaceae bacterium]|nr:hypothetical protein [Pirellulaceae bacterium]
MTWYQDLAPCDYFGPEATDSLRAVGWLAKEQDFPIGRVKLAVFRRLQELLRDPWQPGTFRGFHDCELCSYEAEGRGWKNLFVPGDGVLYVTPDSILHYMNAHGYRPPDEFCNAVLACPHMGTQEYRRALVKAGCGKLLKRHVDD